MVGITETLYICFMNKKIKIKESVVKWSGHELDGTLPDAIAKLQKLITDNQSLFDFEIEIENESGWYGESSTNIIVDAFRWETDEEMEARISANNRKKELDRLEAIRKAEANEKREKSLYESLKKKFEKEIDGK